MEPEILQQLIWIKWLLAAIVFAFVVIGIAVVWLVIFVAKIPEHLNADASFSDRAKSLLDQDKPGDVVSLAEARISKYPADALAHWFLAQACYRSGDFRRALISLRRTQELQPEWETTYTGPLISAIEQRIAGGNSRAELKVIAPNTSPPAGGEPVS